MVLFVEFSILLFTTAPVLLVGVLAPPYHLNYIYYFYQSSGAHYSYRGGSSGYGFACGFACVVLVAAFSASSWGIGAALSFK